MVMGMEGRSGGGTSILEVRELRDSKAGVRVRVREKAMAPHSSTLAWKIAWMEEPGRLQFIGSLRVGHD